jgi:hypothetical protein
MREDSKERSIVRQSVVPGAIKIIYYILLNKNKLRTRLRLLIKSFTC